VRNVEDGLSFDKGRSHNQIDRQLNED